jgi:hypothetical protein
MGKSQKPSIEGQTIQWGKVRNPLYCLSFYLWCLTFPHCIVCPSIYGFWLFPIVLSVLLFMVSDLSPLSQKP